jgi:hypothetical protein
VRTEEVVAELATALGNDPTYAALRAMSQRFRGGVARLFFDVHPELPKLIRAFGVF